MKKLLAIGLPNVVFIMLINVKMPIVVILTFISRINFVLSWVEHEKSFITSGPGIQIRGCINLKLFACWIIFHAFVNFFKKIFHKHYLDVRRFGSRFGPTFCRSSQDLGPDNKSHKERVGVPWLHGRELDSIETKGLRVQASALSRFVFLSKTHWSLLCTGSTQEDLSRHNWKIVDWG